MRTLSPAMKFSSVFVFLLILTACSTNVEVQPTSTAEPPTSTPIPATDTPLPPTSTATAIPTDTPTASPTVTQTPTSTPTPTVEPTATPTATNTTVPQSGIPSNVIVKYLVIEGTGDSSGCGSLVPVSAGIVRTGDVNEDVKLAINSLFSTGSKYAGNLYNPLYQSKLRVNDVSFKKNSGNVTIRLTGSFTKPKEDCDKLLYRAQVWDTARQFPEVKLATIWLNKYLLGDLLVVGDN
ncbi:MAG: hypothetical protein ACWGN2_00360 [Anaerolineales bacterium]